MKIYCLAPVLFFLVCGGAPAFAEDNLLLDEIEVRGRNMRLNEESLNVREVRESPARDMGEALKQVEGINIVHKGAIANDVVLRGFQKDNINVLVDGVRVNGVCPNRMDSPSFHYDFAEIEQVKVVKGPYDLSTSGGMGGTIDAISKKPGLGRNAELNLTAGSYNSVNASADASYGSEKCDVLAGYAYKASDAPRSGDGKLITAIYPLSSAARYRPDSVNSRAYDINTDWVKLGINTTKNSRLGIDYSYQDASHVLYPYLLMDGNYDRTTIFNLTYRAENVSGRIKNIKTQFYRDWVYHLMDDSLRASSNAGGLVTRAYSMRSDGSTRTCDVKVQGDIDLGKGTLTAGADMSDREWNIVNARTMYTMSSPYTSLHMIPGVSIVNYGVFGEYALPVMDKTTLSAGARGDFAHTDTDTNNNVATQDRVKKQFYTLAGNIQLKCKPGQNFDIFAGLARGTRIPDPKELFISVPGSKNTFGNPDLKPTVNDEADIGVKYSRDKYYVNATLFYSTLTDFINLRGFQAGAVSNITYENVNAIMWGGELGSQVALPVNFFVKAGVSYSEGQNSSAGRPLSEIPPLKGTAALRYDKGDFFIEAAENLAARQYRVDASLQESQTEGWDTTDLKAGWIRGSLSVYAGVYNIFDKYYFTHLSYLRDPFASGVKVPENGINAFLTVSYKI